MRTDQIIAARRAEDIERQVAEVIVEMRHWPPAERLLWAESIQDIAQTWEVWPLLRRETRAFIERVKRNAENQ